jgi:hypothetical protein
MRWWMVSSTRVEQAVGMAESDKRAALEAIKKRFYDDLHDRMEIFFSAGRARNEA